jgi:succinoglycan biosynthesis transport protein ExoP
MAQYELNLRDYWRILRKRKNILILTMLALSSFTFIISEFRKPSPLYKATSQVRIEHSSSLAGLFVELFTYSSGDNLATQARIIKSFPVMERVAKRLSHIPQETTTEEIHKSQALLQIISDLQDKIQADRIEKTNIIEITVTSPDPEEAQKTANWTAEEYREVNILSKNRQVHDARDFIEEQLKIVGQKLRQSEEDVKIFKEKNKIVALNEEVSSTLKKLVTAESDYNRLTNIKQEILQQIETVTSRTPLSKKPTPRIFTEKELSVIFKLNNDLLDLQLKRDNLLLTYLPQHPMVKEVDAQIDNICGEMLRELKAKLSVYRTREKTIKAEYDKLKMQNRQLPQKALKLARLEREVKINEDLFSLLKSRYQEVLIKESERIEEVSIVKPALLPQAPINPPQTANNTFVGGIIGLMLGLVLSFVFESLDTSIGAIEDVEAFLNVPVLGVIPYFDLKRVREAISEKTKRNLEKNLAAVYAHLISHFVPKSPLSESYRSLRTSVQFAISERNIKSILLTSVSLGEGKTTTAINLAITFSQMGKKVLLVDADLRKPVIHQLFGIDKAPGLSEILIGSHRWEDAVQTITDLMLGHLGLENILSVPGFDNINIITSGTIPHNPSEFLNSSRMDEQIRQWQANYDLIIFDAPPALPVTDAVILGSKTDGIIIVYQVGKIARSALKRIKLLLENTQAKVLGVVLNAIKAEISPDFYQFSYSLYRYYGREGEGLPQNKSK